MPQRRSRLVRCLLSLLSALILAAALSLPAPITNQTADQAAAHTPPATGGLHLTFGSRLIAWPAWQPGDTVAELWRDHSASLRAAGVHALWLRSGPRWLGYALDSSGRAVPGSADFEISPASQLGYSGGAAELRIDPAAIQQGRLAGLLHDRNILGDPNAPVLIIDYGDFL